MKVYFHSFLTSTLKGGEWLDLRSGLLTPEETLNIRLDDAQCWSEHFREEIYLLRPPGFESNYHGYLGRSDYTDRATSVSADQ
jgi:hypothetical protein